MRAGVDGVFGGVGMDGFLRDVGDRGGRPSIEARRGVARGEDDEEETNAAKGAEGDFGVMKGGGLEANNDDAAFD